MNTVNSRSWILNILWVIAAILFVRIFWVPGRFGSNQLLIGPSAQTPGTYSIPIHPMEELDFKTKDEIYELRKKYVLGRPQLAKKNYRPSHAVFGQIESGRPWWGIHGIYFYGPGERSILGLSEETRFLSNPFLLVGLSELRAYPTSLSPDDSAAYYPKPLELRWRAGDFLATVRYDVSSHFNFLLQHGYHHAGERQLELAAYNARDFGFNYLYVDPLKSKNIAWLNQDSEAVHLRQFLHRGGSCRYPGGCNNASPRSPELGVRVGGPPAQAYVKLWKDKPKDVEGIADMIFIIEMV